MQLSDCRSHLAAARRHEFCTYKYLYRLVHCDLKGQFNKKKRNLIHYLLTTVSIMNTWVSHLKSWPSLLLFYWIWVQHVPCLFLSLKSSIKPLAVVTEEQQMLPYSIKHQKKGFLFSSPVDNTYPIS